MTVELPAENGNLSLSDCTRIAKACPVSEEQLNRVLHPPAPLHGTGSPRVLDKTVKAVVPEEGARKRLILAASLLGVSILAVIAVVAYTIINYSRSAPTVSVASISTEIPLKEARQQGDLVGAVLTDPSWLLKPEAERVKQLEDAFARAQQSLGAQRLLLLDQTGKTRVMAQSSGGAKPVIQFLH
jgi:hypothetical protein